MKKYLNKDKSLKIKSIIKDWNILFNISRFSSNEENKEDEYFLEIKDDINTISQNNILHIKPQEAQELITKLNLIPIIHNIFPYYTIYKDQKSIQQEIDYLTTQVKELSDSNPYTTKINQLYINFLKIHIK